MYRKQTEIRNIREYADDYFQRVPLTEYYAEFNVFNYQRNISDNDLYTATDNEIMMHASNGINKRNVLRSMKTLRNKMKLYKSIENSVADRSISVTNINDQLDVSDRIWFNIYKKCNKRLFYIELRSIIFGINIPSMFTEINNKRFKYVPFTDRKYAISIDNPYVIVNVNTKHQLSTKLHKGNQYIRCTINKHNEKLHRMICLAFVPNDDVFNRLIVDHMDRNKLNNDLRNLRWSTYRTNTLNVDSRILDTNSDIHKRLMRVDNMYYDPVADEYYEQIGNTRMKMYARIKNIQK